jgi:hypothetical protein
MIGVRSSSSVGIIVKRVKIKYRFPPDVLTTEMKKICIEAIKTVFTHIHQAEDKIQTLPFIHVSVNEDDFPPVIWEYGMNVGCLTAPFCWRLNLKQIYSSEDLRFTCS